MAIVSNYMPIRSYQSWVDGEKIDRWWYFCSVAKADYRSSS